MNRRTSGVLFHLTSLPSSFGIGDFGPEAYAFVDFLSEAKQSFWQILPLNPTDPAYDNSPYHSISAFAVNSLLISPELLRQENLLRREDLEDGPAFPEERVDYLGAIRIKKRLFQTAFENFKKKKQRREFEEFCSQNGSWLEDFSLFVALKERFRGQVWSDWPAEFRDRRPEVLEELRRDLGEKIEREKFLQFISHRQWLSLKDYCHGKRVHIIGDIPIYVDFDSADAWSSPSLFKLDEQKRPFAVAGVPPDYFSDTGQLWGNPLYRWDVLRERGYDWWVQRMAKTLSLYDVVRIDHFRGLVGYWEVPARETTAVNGRWVEAPAEDFFHQLERSFLSLPIIAEDLGTITPEVREVMHRFGLPGMKVLLFAFGEDNPLHPYLPHNFEKNYVVYTGTHDNNTVRGWFEREAGEEQKRRLFRYLGREVPAGEVHWELIRLAMSSVADTVIVPLQDILGLGEKSRMNRPSTSEGNWRWRLRPPEKTSLPVLRLAELTEIYGRF
jgi:4-alpha-glucanotransferase